jgi:general secretion pathway protein D
MTATNPIQTSAAGLHAGRRTRPTMRVAAAVLWLTLLSALSVHAQFPGGFGGFGGGGNAATSRSRSTRTYPNNGVGSATFTVDPETRNLIIVADPDTTRYITEVVSNLDRPKPQVLIKVVFLEVTRSDTLDLGVEGNYSKNIGNPLVSGYTTNFQVLNSGTTNASVFPKSITPLNQSLALSNIFGLRNGAVGGLYQLLSQDYQVTLHAIATAGKARVLSRPSVVARNNQPATITVGQSVPLVTNVRFDNFGNAINSVTYQSVGIILRVTPFISPDNTIEMILSPETSELEPDRNQWITISSSASGTVQAPIINSRSADTVVVTPDGQTVIIGGLISDSKSENITKIPFLGDIPIIGTLFQHKVKSGDKVELLIFLTPYIIQAPTELAGLSRKEEKKYEGVKGLTEQEVNTFLEGLPTNQPPTKASSKKKKSTY